MGGTTPGRRPPPPSPTRRVQADRHHHNTQCHQEGATGTPRGRHGGATRGPRGRHAGHEGATRAPRGHRLRGGLPLMMVALFMLALSLLRLLGDIVCCGGGGRLAPFSLVMVAVAASGGVVPPTTHHPKTNQTHQVSMCFSNIVAWTHPPERLGQLPTTKPL